MGSALTPPRCTGRPSPTPTGLLFRVRIRRQNRVERKHRPAQLSELEQREIGAGDALPGAFDDVPGDGEKSSPVMDSGFEEQIFLRRRLDAHAAEDAEIPRLVVAG